MGMSVETALDLINTNHIKYRPGWTFEATDYTKRFQNAIMVKFIFPAYHTEKDNAKAGYPERTDGSWAQFPILLEGVADINDLAYKILCCIREIEVHEAREFLKVGPTFWAPFDPHNYGGMHRWSDKTGNPYSIELDLKYGVS